ncbi:GGDEF domain-containing protein [Frateuria terrea]|uniref:diguanylate cyclase n=1 Tax=Frateuria terrea TaxID=529704 RepID=A0A1H6R5H3_9GAMM|nr:GGDEF domain-containing protein [Frateuria terrea]SEI47767.1 diguanylate cyclase (GGDEF) domain-containing protein [Frateuria terrea]SFP13575.1 diguanylate cyclase (GGDEF) domain-containing protein [Frateuria terrea]
MPMHIETLSLISAIQSLALAVLLWAGTHGGPGAARTSLKLRAGALAVESAGWGMLAAQAWLHPAQLLLGGNALNLLAQGMSVVALRMLLGEPLRWRVVLAIGVVGWLGVGWLGVVEPDYRLRVLWGSAAILVDIGLRMQALLHGGLRRSSRARVALLAMCSLSVLLLLWRNGQLWFDLNPPANIMQPDTANYLYVLLSGMQPLFLSIGFLLLYSETLQRELHLLARVDALTGVKNRLALTETAAQLLSQAARVGRPLGVLMIDADHFKSVNDRFGHGGGDKVLLALVGSIRATLRASNVIGRIGGEEFVVLAPDTSLDDALVLAERIRETVECTPLLVDGHLLQLTVSIGAVAGAPGEHDVKGLLQRADAALYAAKRAGRNRVMAADPELVRRALSVS